MKNKNLYTTIILLALIILENLCLYYFFRQGLWTTGKNAICLFLSSLSFGVVVCYRFYNVQIIDESGSKLRKWSSYFPIFILLMGLVGIGFLYSDFFIKKPVSHAGSDVIPLIQIACRRLLAGEYPYRMVSAFGFDQDMTYLPMHWMPFCVPEWIGIDYRWVSFSVWAIASIALCARTVKVGDPFIRISIPVLLLASNYVMFHNNDSILEGTVELMITGYYMLLVAGFNSSGGLFPGVIIAFCLLSRYSVVLWLPLYAFVLFITGNKKQLYIAAGVAAALVLLLYVIPFMSRDPAIFYNGYKYYDKAALFEWTHLTRFQQPLQLFHGTGFAYYFYTRFTNYDIPGRIKLLQQTHLVVCLAATVIMGIWFYFRRDKINHKVFLMGSFKIYLTFFLFLIQVPYEYLMSLGNFVSIAIFCEMARYRVAPRG